MAIDVWSRKSASGFACIQRTAPNGAIGYPTWWRPSPRSRLISSSMANCVARLCNKARKAVPCLFLVESFPEGEPVLEWCEHYQLEGIVSKRLSSRYSSGPCRDWQKTKCDGWRE